MISKVLIQLFLKFKFLDSVIKLEIRFLNFIKITEMAHHHIHDVRHLKIYFSSDERLLCEIVK